MAAVGRHHRRGAAAFGRGTSSVVSFVVAMNRVDVVGLVVDLVEVDLDIDLVDVDLNDDLVEIILFDVVSVVFSVFGLWLYLCFLVSSKKQEVVS